MMGFVGMGRAQTPLDDSYLLDAHLNRVFGPTFAEVIEYETRSELGVSLYEALRDDPSGAVAVLKRIFKRGEAVGMILQSLRTRLSESRTEQDRHMITLFDQAMPLVSGVID
jgi:hypothetical protein